MDDFELVDIDDPAFGPDDTEREKLAAGDFILWKDSEGVEYVERATRCKGIHTYTSIVLRDGRFHTIERLRSSSHYDHSTKRIHCGHPLFETFYERGKKCNKLVAEPCFVHYCGPAWVNPLTGGERRKVNLEEDIMLDAETWYRNNSQSDICFPIPYCQPIAVSPGPDNFVEIAPWLFGYAPESGQWVQVHVDYVGQISWRETSLNDIYLRKDRKDELFTIFKGKRAGELRGKCSSGFLLWLYGPPGSGKTFTVQSLANELKVPIVSISLTALTTSASVHNIF